ncbi:MAG: FumA C-terminus/TtdB family hydratase beta subunit [Candidatus Hadarchaeota archaeon]
MKNNRREKTLNPPLSQKEVRSLKSGEQVRITGRIITARDEAYQKIIETKKDELPLDLEGMIVYHCGPLVKKNDSEWKVIAAGPTTSGRMDDMEVEFVRKTGVKALIGKGGMSKKISQKLADMNCVYLAFTGGAAALAADSIVKIDDVHFVELGIPEAIWLFDVKSFGPLLVTNDLEGNNLYER